MDKELSIVPFKFKYLPALIEMLQLRNFAHISLISMQTLPKVGYIAFLGSQPIAAGFLRRVEGGYAQIDTLTSNPYFGSQARNMALVKVLDFLLQEAKDLGIVGIISFSKESDIINRAKDMGFEEVTQTVITLRLKD